MELVDEQKWEDIGKMFSWIRHKRGMYYMNTHFIGQKLITWLFLTLEDTGEFSLPRSPVGKGKGFGKQGSVYKKGK